MTTLHIEHGYDRTVVYGDPWMIDKDYVRGDKAAHYPVPHAIPMSVSFEGLRPVVIEHYNRYDAIIGKPGDWEYLYNW